MTDTLGGDATNQILPKEYTSVTYNKLRDNLIEEGDKNKPYCFAKDGGTRSFEHNYNSITSGPSDKPINLEGVQS